MSSALASFSRRGFLVGGASWVAVDALAESLPQPSAAPAVHPLYPSQAPELVREMVTVAHGNVERVRELLAGQPALARAAWDWGFGDWESALGAASHVGNREIAALLLAHGAAPDLFSAAMLGQLELVKAMLAANPGAQRNKGPHGITLLAHARAGGDPARPVLAYLEALGDADPRAALEPLGEAQAAAIVGRYRYGAGERDYLVVERTGENVVLRRAELNQRRLLHVGALAFFPTGAEAVRIRFSAEVPAKTLTIHDPDLVLTAQREAAAG
jgi:hypothetical protein